MKRLFIGIFLLLFLAVPGFADNFDTEALGAAESFVSIIDDGNFQAAYWSGSALLRLANAEQEWLARTERSQKVLGKVQSRKLKKTRMITSSAHLPDDNYQLILFSSRTVYKAKAHETLLLHQVNGLWRVCAYQIH